MRGADSCFPPRLGEVYRFIPTCVGQISTVLWKASSVDGSSPHAWGRCRVYDVPQAMEHGSSPHAWGRSATPSFHAFSRSVHPHMRGADVQVLQVQGLESAVHPHMRGADERDDARAAERKRFIPTCVGQMGQGAETWGYVVRFIPTCVGQIYAAVAVAVAPVRFIPTCVGQISGELHHGAQHIGSSPHAWGRCRKDR